MKKIITILVAALAATSAFAQLDFGAGYLNTTWKQTVGSLSETETLNGFYVGADYTVTKLGPINVTPGAYLAYSAKSEDGFKADMFALNIPVNFSFGIDFSNDLRGFIYAGPTFEIGLSAQAKYEGWSYSLYEDTLKRFDIKLGGGIGLDINKLIRVTAGYNAGLLNMSQDNDYKAKFSQFHVGVAYLF